MADSTHATCDDCKGKFHLQCTDLSIEFREIFARQAFSEGLFYRCSECRTRSKTIPVGKLEFDLKMNEIFEKLNQLNSEFSKRLGSIESQNLSFPKEVKESITSYAKVVSDNIKENNETKKFVSSMSESFQNLNSKMEEERSSISAINKNLTTVRTNIERNDEKQVYAKIKAQKMNNVCVFNVPELESDDAEVKYKRDVEIVKTVLNERVKLEKEDVKAIYRIGTEDSKKPRPLIIKFSSVNKKNEITKLKNIVYNDEKGEHKLFITPDRTRKEQAEYKELLLKLKERKLNGEQNIGIRNGKIIQLQPFRPDPRIFWG